MGRKDGYIGFVIGRSRVRFLLPAPLKINELTEYRQVLLP